MTHTQKKTSTIGRARQRGVNYKTQVRYESKQRQGRAGLKKTLAGQRSKRKAGGYL